MATVLAADCGRVSNPRHAKCVHIISELAVLARQRRLGRSDLHRRLMAFLWRANADYLRSRSALSAKTRGDCPHRFGPPHWRISAVYRMDVDECDAGCAVKSTSAPRIVGALLPQLDSHKSSAVSVLVLHQSRCDRHRHF